MAKFAIGQLVKAKNTGHVGIVRTVTNYKTGPVYAVAFDATNCHAIAEFLLAFAVTFGHHEED